MQTESFQRTSARLHSGCEATAWKSSPFIFMALGGCNVAICGNKIPKNIPKTTVAAGSTAVCAERGVNMRSLCLCHVQICWILHQNQKPFLSWKGFILVYSKSNDFLSQRKNRRTCGFVVSTASFHISYNISVLALTDRPTNCYEAECSACCHSFWVWRKTETKL